MGKKLRICGKILKIKERNRTVIEFQILSPVMFGNAVLILSRGNQIVNLKKMSQIKKDFCSNSFFNFTRDVQGKQTFTSKTAFAHILLWR